MRRRDLKIGVGIACALVAAASAAWVAFPTGAQEELDRAPRGSSLHRPNPFQGQTLLVDSRSKVRRAAAELRRERPSDARMLEKIARQPQAIWLGSAVGPIRAEVQDRLRTAGNALPVFVAFNRPTTECVPGPAGRSVSDAAYLGWIRELAAGIGRRKSVVILEPDAIAFAAGCDAERRSEHLALLARAVAILKAGPRVSVYLDAGNARWVPVGKIASTLLEAGLGRADGFAVNVSNFVSTDESIAYASSISRYARGAHFVLDVGRNGNGAAPDSEPCNPPGRALGLPPTTRTEHPLADAFLWIKPPGESDGECNGGPPAGHWWTEYALDLTRRAAW